jgi:hypothetical protein
MGLRSCYCNTSNFLSGDVSSFLRTEVSRFVNNFMVSLTFCDIPGTARKTYLPANPTAAKPRPVTMTALAWNEKITLYEATFRLHFMHSCPLYCFLGNTVINIYFKF